MALEGTVSAMNFEISQKFAYATKKDYRYRTDYFYKNSMIKSDKMLIHMPTTELQFELREFTLHLLDRVSKKELSANSVPKYFKGIKWLLDANDREGEIKWKSLESLFPKETKRSGYKAYPTEDLEKMISHTKQIRDKALIHFMASTGARVGIHNQELLIRHLVPMEWRNEKCYAVLVYADEDETIEEKEIRDASTYKNDDVQSGESYWTFLTPEATLYLDEYFESRKLNGDQLHQDSPIFLSFKTRRGTKEEQLDGKMVSWIVKQCIALAHISRHKKGHRFDIQSHQLQLTVI
jgi:integrase/recombinase XerD